MSTSDCRCCPGFHFKRTRGKHEPCHCDMTMEPPRCAKRMSACTHAVLSYSLGSIRIHELKQMRTFVFALNELCSSLLMNWPREATHVPLCLFHVQSSCQVSNFLSVMYVTDAKPSGNVLESFLRLHLDRARVLSRLKIFQNHSTKSTTR